MIVTHYARTSGGQKSEAAKMQGLQDSFLGLQANKWGIWTLKIYEPSIVGLISWDYNYKYNQQKMRSGSTHKTRGTFYMYLVGACRQNGDIKLQWRSGPPKIEWTMNSSEPKRQSNDSFYQTIHNIHNWVIHESQLDFQGNSSSWLSLTYNDPLQLRHRSHSNRHMFEDRKSGPVGSSFALLKILTAPWIIST